MRAAGALCSASFSRFCDLAAGKNKETDATTRMRTFPVFVLQGDPVPGGSCRCHFPPPCVVTSSSVTLAVRHRKYFVQDLFFFRRGSSVAAVVRDGGARLLSFLPPGVSHLFPSAPVSLFPLVPAEILARFRTPRPHRLRVRSPSLSSHKGRFG